MKKLITILMFTMFASVQGFAQELDSGACNVEDPTCQSFQLEADAYVLRDFTVTPDNNLSLGKVRRGEQVEVNMNTDGHRGKVAGMILVEGDLDTSFTIKCIADSSVIIFQGSVSKALDRCEVSANNVEYNTQLNGQLIPNEGMGSKSFYLDVMINVPIDAQDGDVSGSAHIELSYE